MQCQSSDRAGHLTPVITPPGGSMDLVLVMSGGGVMVGPRRLGVRRSLAIAGSAAVVAVLLSASMVSGSSASMTVRVLQFNLCNSGIADCYTGRSVSRAAALVHTDAPDVVTLNEICRDDVAAVSQAMPDQSRVASAFQAAGDRRTGGQFRCRNGQPFGIGIVVRLPATSPQHATSSGSYPTQDLTDPEERVFLCVRAIGAFDACTTHLASDSSTAALAQCHYLLTTAVPGLRAVDGGAPAVVSGDFNLVRGGRADVRGCVPPGYVRIDDGEVQQVIATSGSTVASASLVDMRATTDHLGLMVTLTTHRG